MYKKIKCELKDVSCEFISKFLLNAKNSIRNYFFSKIWCNILIKRQLGLIVSYVMHYVMLKNLE